MSDNSEFFRPVSGMDLPRFAGVPTFMRLPHVSPEHARFRDVNIGIIGVPWDSGTTNRPGPRHGPRQLRDASTMIRAEHAVSGIRPFEAANCAARCVDVALRIRQDTRQNNMERRQLVMQQARCTHDWHIHPGEGAVCVKCSLLRKEIEERSDQPRHLVTVHGVGYRFRARPGEQA